MARRITIIIEDDEAPGLPLAPVAPSPWPNRKPLYDRLDVAQQQARGRWQQRADYIARCGCNPLNGGSGICGCVPPHSDILFSVGGVASSSLDT